VGGVNNLGSKIKTADQPKVVTMRLEFQIERDGETILDPISMAQLNCAPGES
jgi:hypothetical protein